MRIFIALIFLFHYALSSFAQTEADSNGFTNKAEAKNQTINGLKEGKWVEYPCYNSVPLICNHPPWPRSIDSSHYILTIYHHAIPFGIVREYMQGKSLESEKYFTSGQLRFARNYGLDGTVDQEIYYKAGMMNGIARTYYNRSNYPNGVGYKDRMVEYEENFVDGRRRSFKVYNLDGKIESETLYRGDHFDSGRSNDYLDSDVKVYYESGKLKAEITYINGKKETEKEYDENGNLIHSMDISL